MFGIIYSRLGFQRIIDFMRKMTRTIKSQQRTEGGDEV